MLCQKLRNVWKDCTNTKECCADCRLVLEIWTLCFRVCKKSDLIIIAARPSIGKTTLALDIARMSSINHEKSVLIFSLEMSSQQLVDRMLSAQSRVNAWNLRTGRLSSDREFSKLRDFVRQAS